MNIIKAIIINGHGCDKVLLMTDLPEPCWPFKGNASLELNVARDNGKSYVEQHFPEIEIEVIERASL
jgi:hypothetical protein